MGRKQIWGHRDMLDQSSFPEKMPHSWMLWFGMLIKDKKNWTLISIRSKSQKSQAWKIKTLNIEIGKAKISEILILIKKKEK